MKQRNLWFMVLMSIVTLGIYQLYWLISTRSEMVKKGLQIPTVLIIFLPVIGVLGLFFAGFVLLGNSDSSTAVSFFNIVMVSASILALVAFFPLIIYWLYKYSKAAEKITKNKLSFDLAFWSSIVLGFFSVSFIWPFLVQYYFNQVKK